MKITSIHLEGFRGVRNQLDLKLDGASCVIQGRNALGKSTVADGIEWAISGKIQNLGVEGVGTRAYRHRGLPEHEAAGVTLRLAPPAMQIQKAIDADLRTKTEHGGAADVGQLSSLLATDLILLRDEAVGKMAQMTKGERRNWISSHLGLQRLEELRAGLVSASNDAAAALSACQDRLDRCLRALRVAAALDASATLEDVWEAAANRCQVFGEPVIERSSVALGRFVQTRLEADGPRPEVGAAMQGAAALEGLISAPPQSAAWERFVSSQAALSENSELRQRVARLHVLEASIRLLESTPWPDDECPVCDQRVESGLLQHLLEHRASLIEEGALAAELHENRGAATREVEDTEAWMAKLLDLKVDGLSNLAADLQTRWSPLLARRRSSLENDDDVSSDPLALGSDERSLMVVEVERIQAAAARSPEELSRIEALTTLNVILDRMKDLELAEADNERADRVAKTMRTFATLCTEVQERAISRVLAEISQSVASYYERLHPGEGFTALELVADQGGFEFQMRFRDEAVSPPRLLLSASHMHSVGLVVFLAAAKRYNRISRFILLDDVVNSFDAEHRAELAELLIHEFADWQILLLTHDSILADRLQRMAPGWRHHQITGWSFDGGPAFAGRRSTGDGLDEAIACGDEVEVNRLGRLHIEGEVKEVCRRLKVPVPYVEGRKNEQRGAAEMVRFLRRYLSASKYAKFQSSQFDALDAALSVANMTAHPPGETVPDIPAIGDIRAAIRALDEVTASLTCGECEQPVWSTVIEGKDEMRCSCAKAEALVLKF